MQKIYEKIIIPIKGITYCKVNQHMTNLPAALSNTRNDRNGFARSKKKSIVCNRLGEIKLPQKAVCLLIFFPPKPV